VTTHQSSDEHHALEVAIVGAGIGGLAAAACLVRCGISVNVYEQAAGFSRVGAGIQQGPNAVKVLRKLGLQAELETQAFRPAASFNRRSHDGELTWRRELGDDVVKRYGAPYFYMHRGDLHSSLESIVPPEIIHREHKLSRVSPDEDGVSLHFENETIARAHVVIGADGVHSVVREQLFGYTPPVFTGRVAYRTVFDAQRLGGLELDPSCKWWGEDRHIVIYYTNPRRDEVYFVTSTPEPDFQVESWSQVGDLDDLRSAYRGFHPTVRHVLDACPMVHKWALVEREPMASWRGNRIALMGDACHPMTPYMAQGAATAIEDAAVLSRCLAPLAQTPADADQINGALARYEATRKARTSRIQLISRQNDMDKIRDEIKSVYSYDAWTTPLASEP
jgi:salicylate hydroxylase/6-hydroxynicotinate 3-monooxygenase